MGNHASGKVSGGIGVVESPVDYPIPGEGIAIPPF
jgi:hypothetical protein